MLWSLVNHGVVFRPASAPPRCLQSRPFPRPTASKSAFHKLPRWSLCPLKLDVESQCDVGRSSQTGMQETWVLDWVLPLSSHVMLPNSFPSNPLLLIFSLLAENEAGRSMTCHSSHDALNIPVYPACGREHGNPLNVRIPHWLNKWAALFIH